MNFNAFHHIERTYMPNKGDTTFCKVGYKTVFSYLYFHCYFEAKINGPNHIYFLLKVLLIWKFIAKAFLKQALKQPGQVCGGLF